MKKSVILFLHAGYWILYLLLVTSFLVALAANTKTDLTLIVQRSWLSSPLPLLLVGPGVLSFYSFYTFLFQRWLTRQKLGGFFLAGLLTVMVSGLLPLLLLQLPGIPWTITHQWEALFSMWVFLVILATIHGIIGMVMKGFITWYGEIKLKEDLKKKNLETELALLKSQLNPHFLFNTINNIDVLIETDAPKASRYLNTLSDILRYMLYETKAEEIPLQQELDYIEKYLSLQKIRSANPNYIQYRVEGEPGNHMISPLLFISYIENAFKHAESLKAGNAILITVTITPDSIRFRCENKYRRHQQVRKDHSGLGQELLSRRMELLYPGKHALTITDQDETYIVDLKLQA